MGAFDQYQENVRFNSSKYIQEINSFYSKDGIIRIHLSVLEIANFRSITKKNSLVFFSQEQSVRKSNYE